MLGFKFTTHIHKVYLQDSTFFVKNVIARNNDLSTNRHVIPEGYVTGN